MWGKAKYPVPEDHFLPLYLSDEDRHAYVQQAQQLQPAVFAMIAAREVSAATERHCVSLFFCRCHWVTLCHALVLSVTVSLCRCVIASLCLCDSVFFSSFSSFSHSHAVLFCFFLLPPFPLIYFQNWSPVRSPSGVRLEAFTGPAAAGTGGLALFRAFILEPVRLAVMNDLIDEFFMRDTAKFRAVYPKLDPMFQDGRVLADLMPGPTSDPTKMCTIKWSSFRTPPVVWDRDFGELPCGLKHHIRLQRVTPFRRSVYGLRRHELYRPGRR